MRCLSRVLGVLLAALLIAAVATAEESALAVTVEGGRLSLDAHGVPLSEVLQAIARQARITVYMEKVAQPEKGPPAGRSGPPAGRRGTPADRPGAAVAEPSVDMKLSNVPLEEGLRRLLRDRNFILVQSASGLSEVWVYDKAGTRQFARLGPEAGPVARTGRRPPPASAAQSADEDAGQTALLVQQVRSAREASERQRALEELIASADDAIVRDTVSEVLERESNAEVLETALDSLTGLETVPVEPLMKFLGRDRTPKLRSQAVELLGEHGGNDPRVKQLLQNIARTEKDEDVREAAKSALEDLNDRQN